MTLSRGKTDGRLRSGLALLSLACACALGACGDSGGPRAPQLGTVSIVNETDQGMAPLTVEQLFLRPVGEVDPGENLLEASVPPGGIVIVGLFPPGLYNATAVLQGGSAIQYMDIEVRPNEPTNLVIPAS